MGDEMYSGVEMIIPSSAIARTLPGLFDDGKSESTLEKHNFSTGC
jgi:hypothetical protein